MVFACFDLGDEEVEAAAHAIRTTSAERYRTADLSADDVLHLRELTAIVDELVEQGAGMRTVVLSPARLTAFRKAIGRYRREPHRGRVDPRGGPRPARAGERDDPRPSSCSAKRPFAPRSRRSTGEPAMRPEQLEHLVVR